MVHPLAENVLQIQFYMPHAIGRNEVLQGRVSLSLPLPLPVSFSLSLSPPFAVSLSDIFSFLLPVICGFLFSFLFHSSLLTFSISGPN